MAKQLPVNYVKLTWQERKEVRDKYVQDQGGKCMYCNGLLACEPPKGILAKHINWFIFPPNFLKHPVHLQHCHKTDMTEGAVHAYCNAVLWQYEGR